MASLTLPTAFALYQNYPNPSNPATTIRFDLPRDAHVTIRIYNARGEEVATLMDAAEPGGYRSVIWKSTNREGNGVASGVYFYRIVAAPLSDPGRPFVEVRKMMVVK